MKKVILILIPIILLLSLINYFRAPIAINLISFINNQINSVNENINIQWDIPDNIDIDKSKPNIILILADDLGFNDISFYGGGAADGTLMTPHIDSIAKTGIAFNNGYAASAACSPSRAAILTGRYSTRFGFDFTPYPKTATRLLNIIGNRNYDKSLPPLTLDNVDWDQVGLFVAGMPSEEITIAELLQQNGYYTAHIGKWHLGAFVDGKKPNDQGFDDSLLMTSGLYLPKDHPDVVNAKKDHPVEDMIWASTYYGSNFNDSDEFKPNGYLTDYYTEEAVKVINNNKDRPFFLYLSHWAPHNPLQALRSDYEKHSHMGDHTLEVYSGMITALDRGVGKVIEALEKNGLSDNTLIIFTSDNGGAGYIGLKDINKPYRGWKLTFFDGGIHIPFLAKWPDKIKPGSVYDKRIHHVDIFHTILGAANINPPKDVIYDGVNLLPYIDNNLDLEPHETLYWKDQSYQAIIHKNWKLIRSQIPKKQYLFNLDTDPYEAVNLIESELEVKQLLNMLLNEHISQQIEPIWPPSIATPVLIDKVSTDKYVEGDEVNYWIN
tara:strand:- start:1005 stop:2654 length:1650 start_codon:yes stop_codon:yes gene_type:complete